MTDTKHETVPRVAVNEQPRPVVLNFHRPAHDTGSLIVAPPGYTVTDLTRVSDAYEKLQPAPSRRRGVYVAAAIDSLLHWMDKNCGADAPVFAKGAEDLAATWHNPALSLIGVGNYSDRAGGANWHDFYAQYNFPVTKAWTDWTDQNADWLSQAEFAEFVEKHLYEFASPKAGEKLSEAVNRMIEALGGTKYVGAPGKMYELANGIKITVHEHVEVALDRSTGESALRFTEQHEGKGGRPLGIPKFFWIRVPIFFGEPESLIGALLRYRNQGNGSVSWSYELFAPDLVVKDAFTFACESVTNTGRTLYLGTPDRP